MKGHMGKIIRANLTTMEAVFIETKKYEKWIGGNGLATAIFFDIMLIEKEINLKGLSGFSQENIVIIATSPLSGTLVPGASARTEVVGIGVQSTPEWFTRSNFGGRFGLMLKSTGFDAIVIEGRSAAPIWLDIRDNQVNFRDANHLWGLNTKEAQLAIWQEITDCANVDEIIIKPAVLTIGPVGETLSRLGALIHDAGNAAGQGGFGAVWGSKKLKAISALGSQGISVANPEALYRNRIWAKKKYGFKFENVLNPEMAIRTFGYGELPKQISFWQTPRQKRPQACLGCQAGCRGRYQSGQGNESGCVTTFYAKYNLKYSNPLLSAFLTGLEIIGLEFIADFIRNKIGHQTTAVFKSADLLQQAGLNAYEMKIGLKYLAKLHQMGVLGQNKAVATELDFNQLGTYEFMEKLVTMIIKRQDIGQAIAAGFYRAAKKWNRQKKDLQTGILSYPYWGLPGHQYDPRAALEWGYGSILGDRDINQHLFNFLLWMSLTLLFPGKKLALSTAEIVDLITQKMPPFNQDEDRMLMLNFSQDNMYSTHIAKLLAWHRYYERFWTNSVGYCDFLFADFTNPNTEDNAGITGVAEHKFFQNVTGEKISFQQGLAIGRKIWNLANVIWIMQGRCFEDVNFADYIYDLPLTENAILGSLPGLENGQWKRVSLYGRKISRQGFTELKKRFYRLMDWDPETGIPTRATLETLGLGYAADALQQYLERKNN